MSGGGWKMLATAPVANGYIEKPIDPTTLVNLVEHVRKQ